MPPKTLIIVPALNESGSIVRVVSAIREHVPYADVVVINDGSTDNTAELARRAGAIVLQMPYNVGIGAAVQTGFLYAARAGYEVAVQTDGDGQHPPSQIPGLIAALHEQSADMMIGSRFLQPTGYEQTAARRAGGILLAWILRLATGQPISDPTSGFRASGVRAIALCARYYPHDYPEPEAVILLRRAGLIVKETPIEMHPRRTGRSSITPLRSGYYMVKVTLAILIHLLRAPRAEA
ncbi:MAG: glycosyltransferase family 2 protein [Phototrophicaceae bacterium]